MHPSFPTLVLAATIGALTAKALSEARNLYDLAAITIIVGLIGGLAWIFSRPTS